MTLYRIHNWNKWFENNRSRKVDELTWVPIPNKHDGESYAMIMANENGAQIYAAWVLMLQVASKCATRGVLLRDNGQPHTPFTLSLKTRAPENWFCLALEFLIRETDWIEHEEFTSSRQVDASQVPPNCHPCDEEGKEGKEENGKKEESGTARSEIPTSDEVKQEGAIRGYPFASVQAFFDHHQNNNLWLNQFGRLINWKAKLSSWVAGDRQPKANASSKKPTRWQLSSEIEILNKRIEELKKNDGLTHDGTNWTGTMKPETKETVKRLRAEIDKLKAQIDGATE